MKITIDRALIKSVISLASVIEARDPYTGGHTWRVGQYAVKLAEKAGLSEDELFVVNLGGLVHDLGKVGISDSILLNPGTLTFDEYENMKQHPQIGYELIMSHPLYSILVDSVTQHHERVDGTGYPNGISGSDLSIIGRITAIADSFDAMTSTRPYRVGMTAETAISILESEKNKQFDAELVDKFVELFDAGALEHILGHCGDERLMLSCTHCGPIIVPSSKYESGDFVICPACRGEYMMKQVEDSFGVEFTGKLLSFVVPKADMHEIDAFMNKLPNSIELKVASK